MKSHTWSQILDDTLFVFHFVITPICFTHHHVALPARVSQTLSHHPSLSSIARGVSSGLYPESAQSCCIYILAGRPAFSCPCEGVHRSVSLTSSSLLHKQCPACLVRLWEFSWWVIGSHTAAVLWGVTTRTYSILLAAFLCNCRHVFSPHIYLASM